MNKTMLLIGIMILICAACSQQAIENDSKFAAPDPETYVSLMPLVREYFYYRKGAVLSGEMTTFYERYPDLADGSDLEQGINIEGFHVENMAGLEIFDGNIFPEYYESIKIWQVEEGLQIQVHGMALYLRADSEGKFDETGGEFKIVLFFRREGSGWQIYKTDEVTLPEWKGESGMTE